MTLFSRLFKKETKEDIPVKQDIIPDVEEKLIEEAIVEEKTEAEKLLEHYLSTKSEIKYLEDRYDESIIKSIEFDYHQYTQYIDKYYPFTYKTSVKEVPRPLHWTITDIDNDRFYLNKKNLNNNTLSLKVSYTFNDNVFKLTGLILWVNDNNTKIDMNKFRDILYQYILYWKVKEAESEKQKTKNTFQKMIDIIGKDVQRDSIIDELLK